MSTFNLSTGSKQFKDAMKAKNIVTGGLTEKGAPSYGKDGIKVFDKAVRDLEAILKNKDKIFFSDSELNIRQNVLGLTLATLLLTYGKEYFQIRENNNSTKVLDKKGDSLTKEIFVEKLTGMLQNEKGKLHILKKIQENSSLTKAVNSYISKLAEVDTCRMRYKLVATSSGRLASGNGSKSDKKKNHYYIDLNAQNLTKPDSCFFRAFKDESKEDNILGWCFEQVTDEYAANNRETDYIVEGFSPELNIRNAIIAPEGKYILSLDYSSQEYILLALLSGDSKMISNFKADIDPHTAVTHAIWGAENYTKQLRKKGKGVNFALNYGGTAYTLHKNLEIPIEEAKFIIERYEEEFFECIQWKKNEIAKTFRDNNGVAYTLFGRPRKLQTYMQSAQNALDADYVDEAERRQNERTSRAIEAAAGRKVVSHEIQGFCGDICRYILIKLYDTYFKAPKNPDIDFLSAVHDEVNFIITKEKVVQYARELSDLMRFTIPGACLPIETSIDIGYRWGSAFCFEFTDENRTEMTPKRVH
jgi:hypothetical protein